MDGETLHRDLSAQVERLSADLDPGEGIRHDAAVLILGRLRGVPLQYDNDLLSLTDDAGHAFDPFTTLYVLLALWREPTPNGQGLFGQVSGQLTDHLLGSQESSGGQRGSWAPREDLGDEPGRMARTAVNLVSVTIYYRYCKLLVTDS